ncbi:MAG: alpha/beta hydrolase [Clostridiales bacterium]|nr:alpha/beta hydrolase [Clostridiales bacterium]
MERFPSYRFKPLIEVLEVKHRVIEYLGYGYSEETSSEKTVENITQEIHKLIQELGVSEPYILMSHSISGIYSHYYTGQYPDEVEALIGNESAVPLQLVDVEIPTSTIFDHLIEKSGAIRLVSIVLPSLITPDSMSISYGKTDLKTLRRLQTVTFIIMLK